MRSIQSLLGRVLAVPNLPRDVYDKIMEELDARKYDEPSAAELLAETVNGGYLDKHPEQKKRVAAFMGAPATPPTKRISIVFYCQQRGGHTHMRVFSGDEGSTRGKAGDLCMTNEEFAAFREQSEGAARSLGGCVEFKEEQ